MLHERPLDERPIRDEAVEDLLDALIDEEVRLPLLCPPTSSRRLLLSSSNLLAVLEGGHRAGILERRLVALAPGSPHKVPAYRPADPARFDTSESHDRQLAVALERLGRAFEPFGHPSDQPEATHSRLLSLFQRTRRGLPEDARLLHYDAETRLVLLDELLGGPAQVVEAAASVGDSPPSQTPLQHDFTMLEKLLEERLQEALEEVEPMAAIVLLHTALAAAELSLDEARLQPLRRFLKTLDELLEGYADARDWKDDYGFFDAVGSLRQLQARLKLHGLPGDPGSQRDPLRERARR